MFVIFYLCSDYAWKTQSHPPSFDQPSVIAMLYGYRDPEQWYVIPRYEFVKPGHHTHEFTMSKILVPPQLPAANPIEFLSFEDISSGHKSKSSGFKSKSSGHNS